MKRLVLVASIIAPTLGSTIGAQQSPESAQTPVFRSGASLVALNVTVIDTYKHFVTGLRQDDFAVFEDGVQQQVKFFESSRVPIDLIVLVDTSSSMQDKMDAVHQAATGFLRTLRAGDRGAVVSFNDRVDVVQPLTVDGSLLEKAVRQTCAKGGTALNNALYVALKEFGGSAREGAEVRRRAVAVLSDGEDTASLISFEDVLDVARRSGVSVYTIGLQSKYAAATIATTGKHRYYSESQYAMKTLAQETGGEAFFPLVVNELQGVYDSIARELSNQYSIGYVPTNTRPDGRFRRIVVQVVSRPELRPKARSGYTAIAASAAAPSNPSR